MNILLIRKPTNLEQHGDVIHKQVGRGSDHFDLLKQAHDEHYHCLEVLHQELDRYGITYTEIGRSESQPQENFNAVITVGGDGTLLTASHYLDENALPIIGIRSSQSSVGYLCAGDVNQVPEIIRRLAENKIEYARRHRLKAKVKRAEDGKEVLTFPVLNDFLFANANPASTTRYSLSIGGRTETHKSSGIWISTATGSTAAISAAGGQVLEIDDPRYQYAVRELYQANNPDHKLQRGFFRPIEDGFLIENHCSRAILALDGERGLIRLKFGDQISFLPAQPIPVAKPVNS